jgi:hypothetical protein
MSLAGVEFRVEHHWFELLLTVVMVVFTSLHILWVKFRSRFTFADCGVWASSISALLTLPIEKHCTAERIEKTLHCRDKKEVSP